MRRPEHCGGQKGFNTQPPKGGWTSFMGVVFRFGGFNTQPPKGGWMGFAPRFSNKSAVSTHSRLKAAGSDDIVAIAATDVSTHSRLKAAGKVGPNRFQAVKVSTHSRLKAAGVTRILVTPRL